MPPTQKTKLTIPSRLRTRLGEALEELRGRIEPLDCFCSFSSPFVSEKPSLYITPFDCACSSEGVRRTTVGGFVRAIVSGANLRLRRGLSPANDRHGSIDYREEFHCNR
jgi:hypothetical protein